MFRTDGLIAILLLVLAAATLSAAHSVSIAFAQELVPERAGTASSLVMGFGWGLAGLGLVAFGSLAEMITVPRALDVAALIPLVAAGLALALPATTAAQSEQTVVPGDIALQK